MKTLKHLALGLAIGLWPAGAAIAQTTSAPSSDVNNEIRITAYPSYPLTDKLMGLSYLGVVTKPEGSPDSVSAGLTGYTSYYLAIGTVYSPIKRFQVVSGLIGVYNSFTGTNHIMEWRLFGGLKTIGMNERRWRYFNFTRYEARLLDTRGSDNFKTVHRVRSQFRLEVPLAPPQRAFTPKTTYLMGEVEPIYRSDRGQLDPIRLRGGLGIVLTPRVAMELGYYAQFTRASGPLKFTDNIWRVNFNIKTKKGVLSWLDFDVD